MRCLGDSAQLEWVSLPDNWKKPTQFGLKAYEQLGHTVQVVGNRVFIIGGSSGEFVFYFDLRKLKWSQVHKPRQAGSSLLRYHSSTLVDDSLFILLGRSKESRLWKFDMICEQLVDCTTTLVSEARQSVFEYVDHRKACIQIPTHSLPSLRGQLMALQLDHMEWYQPDVRGASPNIRIGLASCLVGTTIYTFGGSTETKWTNALHLLECAGHGPVTWSTPQIRGPKPSPRFSATITNLFNGRVLVIGGHSKKKLGDMWLYSIAEKRWTNLKSETVKGQIPEIWQHQTVYFGNMLIVVGGSNHELPERLFVLKAQDSARSEDP